MFASSCARGSNVGGLLVVPGNGLYSVCYVPRVFPKTGGSETALCRRSNDRRVMTAFDDRRSAAAIETYDLPAACRSSKRRSSSVVHGLFRFCCIVKIDLRKGNN
jgi:hypothetical protein